MEADREEIMNNLKEAAEMVLECFDNDYGQIAKDCALADLRRALNDKEGRMTDLRKAAEMALEALHNIDQSNNDDAIEALRQALAQPKREWVGLTDEQIFEHEWWDEETAFAVNKELKEKNT